MAQAEEARELRVAERRKYEAAIAKGQAKQFDWYEPLPALS